MSVSDRYRGTAIVTSMIVMATKPIKSFERGANRQRIVAIVAIDIAEIKSTVSWPGEGRRKYAWRILSLSERKYPTQTVRVEISNE